MSKDSMEKELTVICTSYKRYKQIHVLIHSFLCQTLNNWKLVIIHDGMDDRMRREMEGYTKKYSNIQYMETDKRFNDYGHSLREIGINMTTTPYLMMTNDDNYYVPKFLEYMFGAIKDLNLDFVICDFVSSHNFTFPDKPPAGIYTNLIKSPDGKYIQPSYNAVKSIPRTHCVDAGNFIVRTELAQKVGFRDKGHDGDGTFVEDIIALNPGKIKAGKVYKVLYVHN